MWRRKPPTGYTYLDTLAAAYRVNQDKIERWAAENHFKTAKQWTYTVDRRNGTQKEYVQWIIEWSEVMEILRSLATERPQFFLYLQLKYGPFDSLEEAEKYRAEVLLNTFEASDEMLCSMNPRITEKMPNNHEGEADEQHGVS